MLYHIQLLPYWETLAVINNVAVRIFKVLTMYSFCAMESPNCDSWWMVYLDLYLMHFQFVFVQGLRQEGRCSALVRLWTRLHVTKTSNSCDLRLWCNFVSLSHYSLEMGIPGLVHRLLLSEITQASRLLLFSYSTIHFMVPDGPLSCPYSSQQERGGEKPGTSPSSQDSTQRLPKPLPLTASCPELSHVTHPT